MGWTQICSIEKDMEARFQIAIDKAAQNGFA